METPTLHTQKVAILSRLIKETSLTLEEALLLLKEEEVEETPVTVAPSWTPGTASPWIQPYTGSGTFPLVGTVTTSGSLTLSNGNSTTSTAYHNNPSTPTADLNT
jgi:hypothetical protein